MTVSKKSGKERKLVTVMSINSMGLWLRISYDIDQNGIVIKDNCSLEQLTKNSERTPVYEGEIVKDETNG